MMVKVLLVVMVILTGGLSSALPLEAESTDCRECPAGQYLLSCHECSSCTEGSYTSQVNRESTCHPCFKNCVAAFHMQVVKACSNASDVVCRCMDGFFCSEKDRYTDHCIQCEPIQTSTSHSTTASTTLLSSKPMPNPTPTPFAGMTDIWILIVVLLSVLLIIFITLHLCRQYKKECLKKLVKRCSPGSQKLQGDIVTTSSQRSEPIKHIHAEEVHPHTAASTYSTSDCPTPQPVSTEPPLPAAGNLGPLHIYGANTVFVSLLNQFGQNAGEKDDEDVHQQSLSESDMHCPTPLPLSTEERNRDSSYISFPSQEQGKECHMSKEEGL
ncbi:tumor necrosis factor receptor superfamily member 1A isoform X1 [Pygocentrus nattereri]|uniref:tumor necrosis factor receptor superfamily member 1A isoform X1 n=1 Tax=Pygocentrus nattereri TaxID=42514 RepID=UPI000814A64E|nr:tumor necrosis factor receptor superfamily member 1A isoform X1 [Pygocentrus nattereri]